MSGSVDLLEKQNLTFGKEFFLSNSNIPTDKTFRHKKGAVSYSFNFDKSIPVNHFNWVTNSGSFRKPANRVTNIGQFAFYNNIELTGNLKQHKLSKKKIK